MKCRYCDRQTKLNELTGRHSVLCGAKECSDKAAQAYRNNMMMKYGQDSAFKVAEIQVKAAKSRGKTYIWSDGVSKHVLSNNEFKTCEMLDAMGFTSEDVLVGEKILTYKYKGKARIHIIDFYIPSINLIISVKDGMDNPNTRPNVVADRAKNRAQFETIRKTTNHSFIQLEGKNDFAKLMKTILTMKRFKYNRRVIVEPVVDRVTLIEATDMIRYSTTIIEAKTKTGLSAGTFYSRSFTEPVIYDIVEGDLVEYSINDKVFIYEASIYEGPDRCDVNNFKNVAELKAYLIEHDTKIMEGDINGLYN